MKKIEDFLMSVLIPIFLTATFLFVIFVMCLIVYSVFTGSPVFTEYVVLTNSIPQTL